MHGNDFVSVPCAALQYRREDASLTRPDRLVGGRVIEADFANEARPFKIWPEAVQLSLVGSGELRMQADGWQEEWRQACESLRVLENGGGVRDRDGLYLMLVKRSNERRGIGKK